MINKKYSLQLNRIIGSIIAEIKRIYHENKNLVRLQKDEDEKVFLHIKDSDPESDFYFKVIPVEKRSRRIETGRHNFIRKYGKIQKI